VRKKKKIPDIAGKQVKRDAYLRLGQRCFEIHVALCRTGGTYVDLESSKGSDK